MQKTRVGNRHIPMSVGRPKYVEHGKDGEMTQVEGGEG